MTEIQITTLIDKMNNQDTITTKEILSLGLTKNDIEKLLKNNTIERIERGKYILIKSIHQNEENLISEEDRVLIANKLWRLIAHYKHNKAYYSLKELLDNNYICLQDYNLYIYLLHNLDEHTAPNINIALEDTLFDTNENIFPFPNNSVRKNIFFNNIQTAREEYLNQKDKKEEISKYNYAIMSITMTLLNRLYNKNHSPENEILIMKRMIMDKKYDEIIEYLSTPKRMLHYFYIKQCKALAQKYIDIRDNIIDPTRITSNIKCKSFLAECIANNNFKVAVELSKNYSVSKSVPLEDNHVYLILKDIISLIDSKRKPIDVEPIIECNTESVIKNKQNEEEKQQVINITSIVPYLIKNDIDNALINLRAYLKSINKMEYEFLIIDLIKICLIEDDLTFSKVMINLSRISNQNYSPNINEYIELFYTAISNMNANLAELYLDIIIKINDIIKANLLTDSLIEVLSMIKDMKPNNTIAEPIIESTLTVDENYVEPASENELEIQEELDDEDYYEPDELDNIDNSLTEELYDNNPPVPIVEQTNEELEYKRNKEFIDSKLKIVNRLKFVILNPMPDDKINKYIDILNEYDQVVCYILKNNPKNQLVIKKHLDEYFNKREAITNAQSLFIHRNFQEALNAYNNILIRLKAPKAWVYARIGLCYRSLNQPKNAIPYLTMATYLSQRYQDGDFDFAEMIAILSNKPEEAKKAKENQKSSPVVSVTEFASDTFDNYYGLTNFPKINDYIYNEGVDYITASHELNLTNEEVDLLVLIYARLFYMGNDIERGNLFLKEYEKSSNKTDKTTKIYKDLLNRKRFLSYDEPSDIPISLKLLP